MLSAEELILLNCGIGEDSWSPLDCKIKPVHLEGDQPWIFTGRTDVEAESPIFGHLMGRTDSLEKTLMLGKTEGRIFSSELALHIRWPEDWSFNFSISPSNEYSGLISFRIDWFDLAVQGTLKSLLQHHSSKASILWHSAFFIVQLSHPYMTTRKTILWLDGLLLVK